MSSPEEVTTYCCIEVGPEGIAELDSRGRVVFVPKEQIRRLWLRRGVAAERPWAHVFFACLCFAVAAVAWSIIARWREEGGVLYVETVTGFILVPVGIGILWNVFRPRLHLRVEQDDDVRHVIFRGAVEPRDLERFLRTVETVHGLRVERDVEPEHAGGRPP